MRADEVNETDLTLLVELVDWDDATDTVSQIHAGLEVPFRVLLKQIIEEKLSSLGLNSAECSGLALEFLDLESFQSEYIIEVLHPKS